MHSCGSVTTLKYIYILLMLIYIFVRIREFALEKCASKVKKKNTNNNYLNLTAYCVEWNQKMKWIECNHSQSRIVLCCTKMRMFFFVWTRFLQFKKTTNKMSTEFFFSQMFQLRRKQWQFFFGYSKYYSIFFSSKFPFVCTAHVLFLLLLVGYAQQPKPKGWTAYTQTHCCCCSSLLIAFVLF